MSNQLYSYYQPPLPPGDRAAISENFVVILEEHRDEESLIIFY